MHEPTMLFTPGAPRRRRPRPQLSSFERTFCLRALALAMPDEFLRDPEKRADAARSAELPVTAKTTAARVRKLAAERLAADKPDRRDGLWWRNIGFLGELLGLDDTERELLALALASDQGGGVHDCLMFFGRLDHGVRRQALIDAFAAMMGREPAAVAEALKAKNQLRHSGVLAFELGDEAGYGLTVPELAGKVLRVPVDAADELAALLVEVAPPPTLQLADYAHVQRDVQWLQAYLGKAVAGKHLGSNVLLYGPPGTGKTELARLLAAQLGVGLYCARTVDDDDDPLSGQGRLSSYRTCQALLARRGQALVLFDEVEDAFGPDPLAELGLRSSGPKKAWRNLLLESNPVPAIWISNKVEHLDDALLRRFAVVVRLDVPPRPARMAMLHAALDGLHVPAAWLERAADRPKLAPADVQRAAKVARLVADAGQPAHDVVDWALDGHLRAKGHPPRPLYTVDAATYDLQFVHCDADLPRLVARLSQKPRATLCLSGPPGTGKTAFAAHLARQLNRPLLHVRGSDLLDKYVGETEKRIAELFAKAGAEGAVLFFDEADGLLRDRQGAVRSWEVTQVNEILCQMEAFEGIFLCATNLPDALDAASLRRFHLKIAFKPLRPEQLSAAFLRVLAATNEGEAALEPSVERQLQQLGEVCLGDLHAARRHLEIVQDGCSGGELVAAVAAELAARGGRGKSVGFAA